MARLEEAAARWDRGAIVRLTFGDDAAPSYVWALFAFEGPGGRAAFVWPSYLDPMAGPSSGAVHVADSWVAFGDREFDLRAEGWAARICPAAEEDDVPEVIAAALAELKRQGTTWAEERERVRGLIASLMP